MPGWNIDIKYNDNDDGYKVDIWWINNRHKETRVLLNWSIYCPETFLLIHITVCEYVKK